MSRKQLLDVYEAIFEAVDSPEDGKRIRLVFWVTVGKSSRPYMEAVIDRDEALTKDGAIDPDLAMIVKQIISGEPVNPFVEPRPIDMVDVNVI